MKQKAERHAVYAWFGRRFSLAIITILLAGTGMFGWTAAEASNLTSVSDTLSTSAPSVSATHVVKFTTPTGITSGQTVAITFNSFTNVTAIVFSDVTMTVNSVATTTAASNSSSAWGVGSSGSTVTLTAPTSGTPAAAGATLQITIGGAHQIVNPAVGSYKINIGGTMADAADTMVAIVSQVTMSAAVDTSFTFTVSGVASGQSINGEAVNTSTTTTATAINFGTLAPNTDYVAGQSLAVTTNAVNGFTVTVQENQRLTSSNGAQIHMFYNDDATSTPAAWANPTGSLSSTTTWGHYGITSEDDINTNEFGHGTPKYAGNILTARPVFSNNGPADGSTADKGATRVGIRIRVTSLQQAAKDYTNTLTYVATPVF